MKQFAAQDFEDMLEVCTSFFDHISLMDNESGSALFQCSLCCYQIPMTLKYCTCYLSFVTGTAFPSFACIQLKH